MELSGCSADGSALEWGSRGRWFKSSHSDQTKEGIERCPLFVWFVVGSRTSGLLQFNPGRRAADTALAPRRPLVQIQSLGPNDRGHRKMPSFRLVWGRFENQRPLAIQSWPPRGRHGACAAAAAGSNPVTRTKTDGHARACPFCFGPSNAPRCGAKIRFAQMLGRGYPIPSQTHPMRDIGQDVLVNQRPLAI